MTYHYVSVLNKGVTNFISNNTIIMNIIAICNSLGINFIINLLSYEKI